MDEEALIYNRLLLFKKEIEDAIETLENLGYKTDWLKTAKNTLQFEADYLKNEHAKRA
ncbi:MAG: hypothetical protein IJ122_06510 [Methanobrevibacter sp.]|nr:hypothetical protein [Methanobrevibacter sp.]